MRVPIRLLGVALAFVGGVALASADEPPAEPIELVATQRVTFAQTISAASGATTLGIVPTTYALVRQEYDTSSYDVDGAGNWAYAYEELQPGSPTDSMTLRRTLDWIRPLATYAPDDLSPARVIDLGFDFPFGERILTEVYANTNGLVFGAADSNGAVREVGRLSIDGIGWDETPLRVRSEVSAFAIAFDKAAIILNANGSIRLSFAPELARAKVTFSCGESVSISETLTAEEDAFITPSLSRVHPRWIVRKGLPPGVTFDAETRQLSGRPLASGYFPFTLLADNEEVPMALCVQTIYSRKPFVNILTPYIPRDSDDRRLDAYPTDGSERPLVLNEGQAYEWRFYVYAYSQAADCDEPITLDVFLDDQRQLSKRLTSADETYEKGSYYVTYCVKLTLSASLGADMLTANRRPYLTARLTRDDGSDVVQSRQRLVLRRDWNLMTDAAGDLRQLAPLVAYGDTVHVPAGTYTVPNGMRAGAKFVADAGLDQTSLAGCSVRDDGTAETIFRGFTVTGDVTGCTLANCWLSAKSLTVGKARLINAIITGCDAFVANDCDFFSCTVVGNGSVTADGDSTVRNSIFWGNRSEAISCDTGDGATSYVFRTEDPGFVDAAQGDYRLAFGSPCIDAGDNNGVSNEPESSYDNSAYWPYGNSHSVDFANHWRIVNGRVDIGAYEYTDIRLTSSTNVTAVQHQALTNKLTAVGDDYGTPSFMVQQRYDLVEEPGFAYDACEDGSRPFEKVCSYSTYLSSLSRLATVSVGFPFPFGDGVFTEVCVTDFGLEFGTFDESSGYFRNMGCFDAYGSGTSSNYIPPFDCRVRRTDASTTFVRGGVAFTLFTDGSIVIAFDKSFQSATIRFDCYPNHGFWQFPIVSYQGLDLTADGDNGIVSRRFVRRGLPPGVTCDSVQLAKYEYAEAFVGVPLVAGTNSFDLILEGVPEGFSDLSSEEARVMKTNSCTIVVREPEVSKPVFDGFFADSVELAEDEIAKVMEGETLTLAAYAHDPDGAPLTFVASVNGIPVATNTCVSGGVTFDYTANLSPGDCGALVKVTVSKEDWPEALVAVRRIAIARNWYIDPSNTDDTDQDGSKAHPYADLCRPSLSYGDVLHLLPGNYNILDVHAYPEITIIGDGGAEKTFVEGIDCSMSDPDVSTNVQRTVQGLTVGMMANGCTFVNCRLTPSTDMEEMFSWCFDATLVNCVFAGSRNAFVTACALYNCTFVTPNVSLSDSTVCNTLFGATNGVLPVVTAERSRLTACLTNAAPDFAHADTGDFGLAADSPCVDAGDSSLVYPGCDTDYRGAKRILGKAVDIGAYESSFVDAANLVVTQYQPFTNDVSFTGAEGWWDVNRYPWYEISEDPEYTFDVCATGTVPFAALGGWSSKPSSTKLSALEIGFPFPFGDRAYTEVYVDCSYMSFGEINPRYGRFSENGHINFSSAEYPDADTRITDIRVVRTDESTTFMMGKVSVTLFKNGTFETAFAPSLSSVTVNFYASGCDYGAAGMTEMTFTADGGNGIASRRFVRRGLPTGVAEGGFSHKGSDMYQTIKGAATVSGLYRVDLLRSTYPDPENPSSETMTYETNTFLLAVREPQVSRPVLDGFYAGEVRLTSDDIGRALEGSTQTLKVKAHDASRAPLTYVASVDGVPVATNTCVAGDFTFAFTAPTLGKDPSSDSRGSVVKVTVSKEGWPEAIVAVRRFAVYKNWYIDAATTESSSLQDGSRAHPYDQYSDCYARIGSGDVVHLLPGTYGSISLWESARNVTVVGDEGPSRTFVSSIDLATRGPDPDESIDNGCVARGLSIDGTSMIRGNLVNCRISPLNKTSYYASTSIEQGTLVNCVFDGWSHVWARASALHNCTLVVADGVELESSKAYNSIFCATNSHECGYYPDPIHRTGESEVLSCYSGPTPGFVSVTRGDYRLKTSSPCVDAGDTSRVPEDVTSDFQGTNRVIGSAVDIGAYEGPVSVPFESGESIDTSDPVAVSNAVENALAPTFGKDSPVVRKIHTLDRFDSFVGFLVDCGISTPSAMTEGQKANAYASFVVDEITKDPLLFTNAPNLAIDALQLNADSTLAFTVSLKDGEEAVKMAKAKLEEKIRVGTSLNDINTTPAIRSEPTDDGASLTFTIDRPGTDSGFIRVRLGGD